MSQAIHRQYSNARMSKIVRHGELVFLCGQTSSGSALVGIEAQSSEVLRRVDALLTEAGSARSRLLSATVYLKDMQDFAAMNQVWEAWLPADAAPARTTVQAHLASADLLIEITVVAAMGALST